MDEYKKPSLVDLSVGIVSAFVTNNSVRPGELPALISDVYRALSSTSQGVNRPAAEPLRPAVSLKRSVQPDYVVCLEDGKKFKSLKRHIQAHHDLSPEQYREKWNLPKEYPMVAPNYAAARSALAKKAGLGQQRKKKS